MDIQELGIELPKFVSIEVKLTEANDEYVTITVGGLHVNMPIENFTKAVEDYNFSEFLKSGWR